MRSVIVSGTSGNLGKAVAQKFFTEKYHVFGTVHKGDVFAIAKGGVIWEDAAVDLTNAEAATAFTETVLRKTKDVKAAILTVGGFAMGNITNTTAAGIQKMIQLNFYTAFHLAQPVWQQMMQQGTGRIYLIGSFPGEDTHKAKDMVAYGLSKSLLFQLANVLNASVDNKDVITKVVVPNIINTPENKKAMPDANTTKWTEPAAIADIIYADAINAIDNGKRTIYV
jgi:short-subunit dehydrogenase